MSDLDPQTRDLRAALHDTDAGVRAPARRGPSRVWIVVAILVAVGVAAYFGWGRNLTGPVGPSSSTSAPAAAPASGG